MVALVCGQLREKNKALSQTIEVQPRQIPVALSTTLVIPTEPLSNDGPRSAVCNLLEKSFNVTKTNTLNAKRPNAVAKQHGTKKELIEKVKAIATGDLWIDQMNDDKGWSTLSNKKLLRLFSIFTIVAAEGRGKDNDYKNHFATWPTPRLMDRVNSVERANKRVAATAAKIAAKKAAKAAEKPAAAPAAAEKPAAKTAAAKTAAAKPAAKTKSK